MQEQLNVFHVHVGMFPPMDLYVNHVQMGNSPSDLEERAKHVHQIKFPTLQHAIVPIVQLVPNPITPEMVANYVKKDISHQKTPSANYVHQELLLQQDQAHALDVDVVSVATTVPFVSCASLERFPSMMVIVHHVQSMPYQKQELALALLAVLVPLPI